jgi:hypothetical protein
MMKLPFVWHCNDCGAESWPVRYRDALEANDALSEHLKEHKPKREPGEGLS